MSERDTRQQNRRYAEERLAEIRRELVVGETCADAAPGIWKAVEEELLDEFAELELFLSTGEAGSCVHSRTSEQRRRA